MPFLRTQDSEDESAEAATKNENRNKFRSSASSLTADETLESSEAEPELQEKEPSPDLAEDASAEHAVTILNSTAAYEQPSAYTLEEVEEVEVFDPYARLVVI